MLLVKGATRLQLPYVCCQVPLSRCQTTPFLTRINRIALLMQRMGEVPGTYIAGALIPALIIAILFYFDHTVSAQMAQLAEFNLRKPPAYHYDLFLLGWMTLLCGLLGLPPVNGVLPQVCPVAHNRLKPLFVLESVREEEAARLLVLQHAISGLMVPAGTLAHQEPDHAEAADGACCRTSRYGSLHP